MDPASAGARELLPGLWRLRLPMPWESVSHVNAYAVAGDDGRVLLVDCGTAGDPTCAAALEHALGLAGLELEQVELLVATHAHSDHVGLAAHVRSRSGAPLWAHPADGHSYDPLRAPEATAAKRTDEARLAGIPEERLPAFADLREETAGIMAAIRPDRALADGDVVPSGIGPWNVLETPGHAPSHIALIQRDHGIAIAGDLVCNVFAPSFDVGYSPDPVAETLASLDRLEREAPLKLVLHGHGRPITDVEAVLTLTRDGHQERLATVLDAVTAEPATAYALAERVFGVEDDFFAVIHTHEMHAYLHHLCQRGDLVAEMSSGHVSYQRAAVPERSAVAR